MSAVMESASAARPRAPAAATGDFIGCAEAGTLWGLFCERVRRSPDAVAYRDCDPATAAWRDHAWREIAERTGRLRAALARAGLKPGDRVGLLLQNGIDWVCCDMAALGSGLVVVALYPHDSAANSAYILGHSGARLLILDIEARWRALSAHRGEFPTLERVWIRDGAAPGEAADAADAAAVSSLADVLAGSAEAPAPHPAASDALATLIYTSGATGRPKGVMLSHSALLWNVEATAGVIPPRPDDVFLSILPLAHAFERTVGHYLAMAGGATVAHARSAQDLRQDLLAIRPTVLLGVPRLFERLHAAIEAEAGGRLGRRILRLAAALGWRRFEAARGRAPPLGPGARLLRLVLERLVATRVLAAFGGRLRVAVSGGAPLAGHVTRFLIGLGVPLVEGYGLTEAAPVVTATTLGDVVPGSAGPPLKGIDVKLTAQGELMVHSPAVMTGYWRDEALTARVLDADGWLATGDVAEIRDGRIFIRGRLKDMIVLSIGEKVNPNVVEAEIAKDALFEQTALVGEGRPFLAALIVLNRAAWKRFAEENGADPEKPDAPPIRAKILARLDRLLAALPRHAQVRAVHLTLEPWTIDAGLLTPTLKVKRDALARRFAKEIDALYR